VHWCISLVHRYNQLPCTSRLRRTHQVVKVLLVPLPWLACLLHYFGLLLFSLQKSKEVLLHRLYCLQILCHFIVLCFIGLAYLPCDELWIYVYDQPSFPYCPCFAKT
jgi:hypothetical protein